MNPKTYTVGPSTQRSPSVMSGTVISSMTEFVAGSIRVTSASQQPASFRTAPTVHTLPPPTVSPAPPKSHPGVARTGILATPAPVVGSSRITCPPPELSSQQEVTQTPPSPTATALGNAATPPVVVTRTSTDAISDGVGEVVGVGAGEIVVEGCQEGLPTPTRSTNSVTVPMARSTRSNRPVPRR